MKLAGQIRRMLEGTWDLPQTEKQAKQLEKLLKKPLTAKMVEDGALDGIYGDDEFFDIVDELIDKGKGDTKVNKDVIKSIQKQLKNWEESPDDFRKPFESGAVKIIKRLK